MAKRTRKKGCGTTEQQIERLKDTLGPKGEKEVGTLLNTYKPDVIKLAFKVLVQSEKTEIGLGSRVEAMLAQMPKAKAETMRAELLEAKAKAKAKAAG